MQRIARNLPNPQDMAPSPCHGRISNNMLPNQLRACVTRLGGPGQILYRYISDGGVSRRVQRDRDGGAEEHLRRLRTVDREREAEEVVQAPEMGLEALEMDIEVDWPSEVDHECDFYAHEGKGAGVEVESFLAEVCCEGDDFALMGLVHGEVVLGQVFKDSLEGVLASDKAINFLDFVSDDQLRECVGSYGASCSCKYLYLRQSVVRSVLRKGLTNHRMAW